MFSAPWALYRTRPKGFQIIHSTQLLIDPPQTPSANDDWRVEYSPPDPHSEFMTAPFPTVYVTPFELISACGSRLRVIALRDDHPKSTVDKHRVITAARVGQPNEKMDLWKQFLVSSYPIATESAKPYYCPKTYDLIV